MNTFKYSLRQSIKTPGYCLVAILTLAVGIGVNAGVFSLINGWMLRPLPGDRAGKMVRLYSRSTGADQPYRSFSYPYYTCLREEHRAFRDLAAFVPCGLELRQNKIPRMAPGAYVSSNFFDSFGVQPVLGRCFTATEERPASHIAVGMLSFRLWQQLGADPSLVGQSISVRNHPVTVVGVLPKSFVSASQVTNKEIYLPLGMIGGFGTSAGGTSPLFRHDWNRLMLVGQLQPGLTQATVKPHLEQFNRAMAARYPDQYNRLQLSAGVVSHILMSPQPGDGFSVNKPLGALVALCICVLLIACLNLANMFLARGLARQRNISIRLALGSSRGRIVGQLCCEGLLLSFVGTLLGMGLALWGVRFPVLCFEQWTGGEGTIPIHLDWRMLLMGVGLCLLCTLLFSLGPAWRLTSTSPMAVLKESATSMIPRAPWQRYLRHPLLIVQIALACVLVTTAGFFVRSAWHACHTRHGFSRENSVLIELKWNPHLHDPEQGWGHYSTLLTHLRGLPGVASVSVGDTVPLGSAYVSGSYVARDAPSAPATPVRMRIIGKDYLTCLDVPLRQGRAFTLAEEMSDQGPRVALIDERLAHSLWPNQNPLGRFIQSSLLKEPAIQVVGVVPNLPDSLLAQQGSPYVYLPFGQHYQADMHIHVCLNPAVYTNPTQAISVLRNELVQLDPALAMHGITTWDPYLNRYSTEYWLIGLSARLFVFLGGLALVLAVVGIYGVKSYLVARRTREVGICMALGATQAKVLWTIIKEGLTVSLLGLGLGWCLTWGATRVLIGLLFNSGSMDILVWFSCTAVLALAILAASYIPARRATKVDPMEALRYE